MSNVIQFPATPASDWRIIERIAREALVSAQVPDAAQERVLTGLRPFCELIASFNFSFNAAVTADFPGGVSQERANAICADLGQKLGKAVGDQLSDFQFRLIAERTDREIQNCRDAGLI